MSTAGALRRSRSPIARVCVLTASDTALVLEGRLAQLLPDSSFHAKAAEAFLWDTRTPSRSRGVSGRVRYGTCAPPCRESCASAGGSSRTALSPFAPATCTSPSSEPHQAEL